MKRKTRYYWRSTNMPCFLVTYQKAGRKDVVERACMATLQKQGEKINLIFLVLHYISISSIMYLMENTECEIRWLEVLNSKKDSISINWRDMILLLFQIFHYMVTCHYQCRWTDEASSGRSGSKQCLLISLAFGRTPYLPGIIVSVSTSSGSFQILPENVFSIYFPSFHFKFVDLFSYYSC